MDIWRRRRMLALALTEALGVPAMAEARVPLFVGTGTLANQTGEMLAWLGTRMDLAWDYRPTSWLRAQKLTAAGEGVMYGLARTPEREKVLAFSRPVWSNHIWAVVRDGEQAAIHRYANLNGQAVCWARGSSYNELFARAGLGRMDPHVASGDDGDDGAMRMVAAGRCRAALITLETEHFEHARRHPALVDLKSRGLALVPVTMAAVPLHFAIGLGSRWAWVIERIDETVTRSRVELERLRQR